MAPSNDQPVLVTGASGFIGGRLVRQLIDRGFLVYCLVRSGSGVAGLQLAGARTIIGDVTDKDSLTRALADSKSVTVFHLAGQVRALDRETFTRVNAHGVANIAAACSALADPPVLVVVSSLAAAGISPSARPRGEGDAPNPISVYGRSKLAGEKAAATFAGAVPITVVRPPIVFGPGDRGVLEIFRPIARWGIHLVPGWRPSTHRISLVHVDDLVAALLLAADRGERLRSGTVPGTGIYFIAGNEQPTFAGLGSVIAKAMSKTSPTVIHVPGPLLKAVGLGADLVASVRRRPSWISSDKVAEALAPGAWTCSSAKASRDLGWSELATLGDRLRQTAEWYRRAGWL